MILELLFFAVVVLGAFSLVVMFVLGLLNAGVAALSSSQSPRLDHSKHRQRMDSLFDLNLSAVMPTVVGSWTSVLMSVLLFPARVDAFLVGPHWMNMVLLIVAVSFLLSLCWLSDARHAHDRWREHEASLEAGRIEDRRPY